MRVQSAAVAVITAALAGCAGSQAYHRGHEEAGILRLETCEAQPCDYKVYVQNDWDVGWDGEVPADRISAIKALLSPNCDRLQLVDEAIIERGPAPLGSRMRRTYVMKVKCPKG